jgi:hypothetical protein
VVALSPGLSNRLEMVWASFGATAKRLSLI